MLLFRNNQLISIDNREDSKDDLRVIRTVKELNSSLCIKDAVYALKCFDDGYTFVTITSPFSDNSGLNKRLTSPRQTIGGAIKEAQQQGYKVFNKDIEISSIIIKE